MLRSKLGAVLLGVGLVAATPVGAWADHERSRCYEGDCSEQDYDQWNNEDENRNRNRNRGAFSPGPFEDSPVDFRDNCISLDCGGRDREPPAEGQP